MDTHKETYVQTAEFTPIIKSMGEEARRAIEKACTSEEAARIQMACFRILHNQASYNGKLVVWDTPQMKVFGAIDRSLALIHNTSYPDQLLPHRLTEALDCSCSTEMISSMLAGSKARSQEVKEAFSLVFMKRRFTSITAVPDGEAMGMPELYHALTRCRLPLEHPDVMSYFATFLLIDVIQRRPQSSPGECLTLLGYSDAQVKSFRQHAFSHPRYARLVEWI